MARSGASAVVEQAGGIAFRFVGSEPEILVVRARKDPELWIFPKGHIEAGETGEQAAAREVREEAGVVGRVVKAVHPALEFDSGPERVRVQYFLLHATGHVPADEERETRWCAAGEALQLLAHPDARELLANSLAAIRLEGGRDQSA